ncbi:MAG: alanine racemase [Balneolaceae bacterium]|nr:alanine racemase [Balneolaceae bacterium]
MTDSNSIITINLDVISNNLKILKSYCKPGVEQMAVVKADAYGHGAVKVAQAIAGQVQWFAVNDVYEAVELRENGIKNPILVFGIPKKTEADLYKKLRITATISSLAHFQLLEAGTEYHLNFNTGMNRLGFRAGQVQDVLNAKEKYSDLKCTGIYSHFATADEPGSAKVEHQLQLFKELRSHFGPDLLTHLCNTAGTVECPEGQFDLVRNGIGMYGYSPGELAIPGLKPALSWTTKIVQVNRIKQSETVSYGAAWKADKDGCIGVIPVGYSDGIPRSLSGNFSVVIEENRYPVAGTVTMNYCMVCLGAQELEQGISVQLLGENITAKDWANTSDTIPYEILTGLSHRISREYI